MSASVSVVFKVLLISWSYCLVCRYPTLTRNLISHEPYLLFTVLHVNHIHIISNLVYVSVSVYEQDLNFIMAGPFSSTEKIHVYISLKVT